MSADRVSESKSAFASTFATPPSSTFNSETGGAHEVVGEYVYSQSSKYRVMVGLGLLGLLINIIFLLTRGDLTRELFFSIVPTAIFGIGMFILLDHYFLCLVKTDTYMLTKDALIWRQNNQVRMIIPWKDIRMVGGRIGVCLKRHHADSIDLHAPLFNPGPLRKILKAKWVAFANQGADEVNHPKGQDLHE